MEQKFISDDLRKRAENDLIAGGFREMRSRTENVEVLTHELRVHQAELEIQNEELRQTQDQLVEARDRYYELYDFAPVGYLTLHEDWHVAETNFTAAALLGTERSVLLSQKLPRYLLESETEAFHFYRQRLEANRDAAPFEGWFRRADGTILRAILKVTVVPSGFRAVLMDVTAHRRAEEQLRIKEAELGDASHRLSQIEKTTHDVFYVIDVATGRPLYTSQAFEAMFGRKPTDLRDQQAWLPCVHADDKAKVSQSRRRVADTRKETNIEYRIIHPDGTVRFVRDQCFADKHKNELVGVLQDITQQRALENRLRHAQRMESLGTLAGGIAHDFNNLLMGVAGYLHLAAERLEPAHRALPPIERGLKAVMRGSSLTKQLVTFGDDRQREPQPLVLDDEVVEASYLLRRLVGDHLQIEIMVQAPNVSVLADPGEIEQVLMNLASNARDAMPNGGLLTLQTGVTRSAAIGGDEQWFGTIAVIDTGIGMSEETRAKVFDPFFTTKELGKGTGLGLSTVFTVVRRLNGFVTLDSEIGKGTTVTVALPTIAAEDNPLPAGPAPMYVEGKGETVLLLDDDDDVREAVGCFLETLKYKVLAARTAKEATSLCEQQRDDIRLLVCDVLMPDILGGVLAPQLQKAHGSLPVVYISAHDPAELVNRQNVKQGDRLIRKPFDIAQLAKVVRAALDES